MPTQKAASASVGGFVLSVRRISHSSILIISASTLLIRPPPSCRSWGRRYRIWPCASLLSSSVMLIRPSSLSCAAQSRFKPRAARKWVISRSLRLRPDIGGSLPSQGHFRAMPRPALLHGALAQRCRADHCRRCAWPCYAAAVPRLALPIPCAEIHRPAAALRVHDLPTRCYAVPSRRWSELCFAIAVRSRTKPLRRFGDLSHRCVMQCDAMLCHSRATQCSSSAVPCVAMESALCLGNALPHEPLQWRCGAKLSRAVPQLCGSEQRPCGAYPVHAVAVRVASVLCRRGANLGRGRASLSRCGCDRRIRALPCRSEALSCRAIALLSMPCRGRAEPCRATAAHSLAALALQRHRSTVLCSPSHRRALPTMHFHCRALLRQSLPQLCAA